MIFALAAALAVSGTADAGVGAAPESVRPTTGSPAPARLEPSADGGAHAPPGQPTESSAQRPAPALETIVAAARPLSALPEGRATTTVTREALLERLPQSLPDGLRFEPGVFIQQTAHGQASPYLRGLTGQQTVLLFDGIRLNTSTFRRGPNQYAFSVDARALESVDVLRGGASTRVGTDALGGALNARPVEPDGRAGLHPTLTLRGGTADREYGGRLQVDAAAGPVRAVAGVGGRRVGLLTSGGPISGLDANQPALVPRFEADGKTQQGTGFDEVTGDVRAVADLGARARLIAGGTLYLQSNAPRTDACPPVGGPDDDCLTYERQHRGLAYAALEADDALDGAIAAARATVSWQRLHERRRTQRPAANALNLAEDTVDTLGVSAQARLRPLGDWSLTGGADAALDRVASRIASGTHSPRAVSLQARGQYLDGSTSLTGGPWAEAALRLGTVTARAGGRVGLSHVTAPAEAASGTPALERFWAAPVGFLGAQWTPTPGLTLRSTLDASYRTPNLDDLTARQRIGAGFALDNPGLSPERAWSAELGLKLDGARGHLEAIAFATALTSLMSRSTVPATQCPAALPECAAAPARYWLENLPGVAALWGAELSASWRPVEPLLLRATAAFTRGDAPDASAPGGTSPLSRMPPTNGSAEAQWRFANGLRVGGALRWALAQERLAPSDTTDPRIPPGGTPGFAVFDLRAAWQVHPTVLVSLVGQNLLDTAYRQHGSSINGPGRSLVGTVEWRPL